MHVGNVTSNYTLVGAHLHQQAAIMPCHIPHSDISMTCARALSCYLQAHQSIAFPSTYLDTFLRNIQLSLPGRTIDTPTTATG